jgi:hypothetical protein
MTALHESIRTAVFRTRTERDVAANVLAAIGEAGYVVIERDRWERVREWASAVWSTRITMDNDRTPLSAMRRAIDAHKALQPGDLDPSAEG